MRQACARPSAQGQAAVEMRAQATSSQAQVAMPQEAAPPAKAQEVHAGTRYEVRHTGIKATILKKFLFTYA